MTTPPLRSGRSSDDYRLSTIAPRLHPRPDPRVGEFVETDGDQEQAGEEDGDDDDGRDPPPPPAVDDGGVVADPVDGHAEGWRFEGAETEDFETDRGQDGGAD